MIVPGMLVCSSFLISVCMFIVPKALFISSATVIVRAWGAIWLNPFDTVLFNVFVPVFNKCVWYIWCYVRKNALIQCISITGRGIWACKRCPCLCVCQPTSICVILCCC